MFRPRKFRSVFVLSLALASALLSVNAANAAPGALKIAILEAQCEPEIPANILRDQLLASPGVAGVDFFNVASPEEGAPGTTPSASELAAYDAVIAASDCPFNDPAALGDEIAVYQDAGGVVVVAAPWTIADYYSEANVGGRWLSGGYWPATATEDHWEQRTLSPVDNAHPVFDGVGPLSAYHSLALTVDPAAQVLATWDGQLPAVVIKGRAAVVNELLGDYNTQRTGNFGRLIANLVNYLGKQPVSVSKSGNGDGTVTGSIGGISCGALCSVYVDSGVPLAFTATPAKGSTFTGWSGSCTGKAACSPTVAYPSVSVTAGFDLTGVKPGKLKKRVLSVKVPGPGKLVVSAKGIKKVTKTTAQAATLKIKLKPTKSLKKKLAKKRNAKLKLKLVFTPAGGDSGTTKKTVTIK